MANQGGSTITLKKLLWSKPFNRGFNEVRQGIAMDYDAYSNSVSDRWSYERGRQFAFYYEGKIKYGKEVSWNAINNAAVAFARKSIV